MNDWVVVRKDSEYELVEIDSHTYSLIFYGPNLKEKHIGSIDLDRDSSDLGRAKKMLLGSKYRVIVSKPYDPTSDSDAEQLGDSCGLGEAIERLWENRHSIYPNFYPNF